MRKIYAALLSLIFLLVSNSETKAQVSAYTFAQSSGTFTPIVGGTVIVTASASSGVGSLDDNIYNLPAATIPFTFTFNGTGYTGFNLSTNGFITFGATAPTGTTYSPISSTAAYAGAVAAFGGDMNSVFNLASTTGEIRYETVGTAPNREFVIQWKNFRPGFSTSITSAYVFDFQIRLGENGTIKTVYGGNLAFIIGSTLQSGTRQIGLRGATNTDFNNRLNAAGTVFTASANGTANSSTQAYNNTNTPPGMPSNGLTYTWTPPPPCTTPPAGGTTQSTLSSACALTPFTLSVTGAGGGTGLTYQWQSSSTGLPGSFTDIPAATAATYNATGQAAATYYQRKITCSGIDGFSTPLFVALSVPCYCLATFPSNVEPITLVNFSNINNATSATLNGTPALENFTAIVGNVSKGQTYPITVKGNTDGGFTTQINVYIDWNQDGDFDDAGENFYIGTIVGSTGLDAIQAVGNITIPPTALDGTTRMRVMKKFSTQALPCNSTGFGQAEDYTLSITTPACPLPTSVSIGSVTTTSASVSFTSTGTTYIEYGPVGFTPGTVATPGVGGTVVSGASSPIVIGGLSANTVYDVYVRQECGVGIFSNNTSVTQFSTLCNPITSFPLTETFEVASPTRNCWTTQILTGTYNWTYGAGSGNGGPVTTAHGGTVNARYFGSGYGGEQALLVSPELNLSSPGMIANGVDLEFWVANPSWAGDINPMRVLYKTSAAGSWTVLPGAVFSNPINAWTKIEIANLPNISSTYYIAFEGTQLWGWGLAIDDVVIKEAPSCRKPTDVSAIGVSPTSAELYFTSPGNNFIVEWGVPGFTPGTGATAGVGGTIVTGTASPIVVSGLTASTNYDFYLRRVCVANVDYSENVKVTATTLCAATSVPYLQTFESAIAPGMPTCTSVQDVNGNSGSAPNSQGGSWFTFTGTTAQTYVSPNNSLRYLYDAANLSRPADDWFFLQGLNLTAGTSYRLKFFYKGSDGPTWTERLEVRYGTSASANGMASGTLLFTNNNIATALASPFDSARVDFTPSATGVYYIGFHATSLADQAFLYMDDISVKLAPLVDVGISNMTLPNINCPVNNVFIQAEVKNYNTTTVNFATTPVTINARIIRDGTVITNLPGTVINSGTLAPNATMGVYLTTAYNFIAGSHEIILNTTSPFDPELQNDTLRRLVKVNATPATPVITPAAPQICLGNTVQLSTQFTASPAPVTHPAVTSGALTLAIPDNSPAGISHTLAVAAVPANATVTGISVTLNATHTWNADLVFNLRAPNGAVLNLVNRKGGSGDNFTNCVISSASTTALPTAATSPVTGTFAADAAVVTVPAGFASTATNFAGLYSIANGNWTLAVNDNAGLDVGTLTSWSITITYQVITPVITWTPITGLFTNAGATTAYTTGTNAYSVFSKPAATGTYTYTATATTAEGCTASSTATVTVNPNPVVTIGSIPDTVCISDQIVPLVGNPVGGTWSGIGVSGNNFLPPTTAVGNYTLTYSYVNAFGCPGSATKQIFVKDCPERIILLRDNAITLFPNPTDGGRFNIRINSVLYNKLSMRVYTSEGKIVRTQQFTGLVYGRVVPIDLSVLPGGVYIVKFAYEDAGPRTTEKSFKVIIGH